jgi:hypothetical protein
VPDQLSGTVVPGERTLKRVLASVVALMLATLFAGCQPEVGSDRWCEKMADTPKSDWSVNDAKAFAQHCIFKEYSDDEEEDEERE